MALRHNRAAIFQDAVLVSSRERAAPIGISIVAGKLFYCGEIDVMILSYAAPKSIEEAVNLLGGAAGAAKALAGGTDLLVQLRSGRVAPSLIVDTKKIPGMIGIREEAQGFVIGAATPGTDVAAHAGLRKAWPGLIEAFDLIGSTQIQSRASLAGNLCNASPAADTVPALFAAGAVATVVGAKGRRLVPVDKIPIGPGRTSLANDELILEFRLPARPPHSSDAYLRFIPRTEMDIAVVGCAVNLVLDEKARCTDARVVLGAVAPTAVDVPDAAKAMVGQSVDESVLARVEQAARAACKPIDDKRGTVAFRTQVAGVLARRVATIAFTRARADVRSGNGRV